MKRVLILNGAQARFEAAGAEVRVPQRAEPDDVEAEAEIAAHQWADLFIQQFAINKQDMFSATLNAPQEAFEDPAEPFVAGRSIDDLLYPQQQNMRFFGLSPPPNFAAYDATKTPNIHAYLARFDAHLEAIPTSEGDHAAA